LPKGEFVAASAATAGGVAVEISSKDEEEEEQGNGVPTLCPLSIDRALQIRKCYCTGSGSQVRQLWLKSFFINNFKSRALITSTRTHTQNRMLKKEKYRMPCAYEFWMVARARWAKRMKNAHS